MPSIDERIVSMAFQNSQFEAGVAKTMGSLSKLDAALAKIGQQNGLQDIEKAANKVTLQQPMSALDKLKARFSRAGEGAAGGFNEIERAGAKVTLVEPIRALNKVQSATADVGRQAADGFGQIEKSGNRLDLRGAENAVSHLAEQFTFLEHIAANALGGIAAQAASRGASFAKSFSFGPVMQGFDEYQTNLGSIQTIMANTEGQRISGLDQTNKHLQELNTYSDQTIYNFSQMAKNIGTFTAAGVDLDTSTKSIKGIANLAALSGSNSQQASTAMYQLSQAIAAGKVGLQDWNSVVNAGMGGRKFQNSLIQTGVAMGTIKEGAVKIDKATGKATINGQSFRESIMARPGQKSWLTSEVLTGSLQQFTGDMSDAQLKAKGFTDQQIKSIQATAKTAKAAATQVKTLPQVFDVAKETIGSGWAKTFQLIFGDFKESKKTFTELSNTINGAINKMAAARNKVLGEWKKLGGREVLIQGLKQAFKDLGAILKPIHDAFREIFPPKTGKDLFNMTKSFADLMKRLQPSAQVVDGLKRTFAGLFAILHIGWSIVKGIIGVIGDLLGVVGHGSGGFLNLTGSIGDFLVAVDSALTKGGLLESFFKGLSAVLQAPLKILGAIGTVIGGLFKGDTAGADQVAGGLDKVKGAASPLGVILDRLKHAWDGLVGIFRQAKDLVSPWLNTIGEQLSKIGDTIANAFKGDNFNKTMNALQTAFVGGIFLAIKKALGGASSSFVGILKPLNQALGALTTNLQTMQKGVKAATILMIATAIGLLAASALVLSKIKSDDLAKAMGAISIGLGQLVGALALLSKVSKGGAFLTMPILAASLMLLAGAMVILAAAMKIFSTMSWDELAKGLVGVGGGLTAIAAGMKFMGGPQMIVQAGAIFIIALALNALALAVKQFASMDWESLGRGIAGVLGALIAAVVPLTAAGPEIAAGALAIIPIALGLGMLAGAVKAFASMDLKQLATGIGGAAVALVAIGLALEAIPPHALLLGAGLLVVAIGLTGIATAVKAFGSMSVGSLAKGIIAMGAALLVLAVGLTAMIASLPGAAALLVAAGALALLAPTLGFLGTLEWGTIFKGLAAIALTLGTLAIAGMVAAPGLIALGVALLPLGLAFTLVAAAAYLLAKGLALLATDGTKGIAVMIAAITAFLAIVPKIVIEFVKGLVETIGEIAKIAPQVVDALAKILGALIQVVIKETPRLATAIGTLVDGILQVIIRDSPKLIRGGITLMLNLLKGLDDYIPKAIPRIASIVTKFLIGFANAAPKLTAAGAKALVAFLKGMGDHAAEVTAFATRIVLKIYGVFATLPGKLVKIAAKALIGFLDGIANSIPKIASAAVRLGTKFLNTLSSSMVKITNVAADALIDFLNGFADAVRKKGPEIRKAGWNVASALIDGFLGGLKDLWHKVKEKLDWLADTIPGVVKKGLDILSPSKVMREIGQNVGLGLALGIEDTGPMVAKTMRDLTGVVIAGVDLSKVNFALTKGTTDAIGNMLRETKGLKAFGQFLGHEFRDGLTGGLWDTDARSEAQKQIDAAFDGLKLKLTENHKALREKIKGEQDKLDELLNDPKKNGRAIDRVRAAIAEDQKTLALSQFRSRSLMAQLEDEKKALSDLAVAYEQTSKDLEKAKAIFDDYKQQYNQLPDLDSLLQKALEKADGVMPTTVDGWIEYRKKKEAEAEAEQKQRNIDQVANYKKALQEQITATSTYMETLKKLRAAGLDDATYEKLLKQGTSGQEFASQLLAKGKAGIDEINKLDAELAKTAVDIANNAAEALYKAGEQAATGFIKGLEDQQGKIREMMDFIANTMIKSLKFRLGIRSPSRVFAEMGRFTAQGLVDGLSEAQDLVGKAATDLGNEAANALSTTLASIQNGVDTDLTITPVLDLTQIQKDASQLQDLTNVTPITAAASYGQAAAISDTQEAAAAAQAEVDAQPSVAFNFEQNNTSPKALDDVEIYRQTRNELSKVKSALGLVS